MIALMFVQLGLDLTPLSIFKLLLGPFAPEYFIGPSVGICIMFEHEIGKNKLNVDGCSQDGIWTQVQYVHGGIIDSRKLESTRFCILL